MRVRRGFENLSDRLLVSMSLGESIGVPGTKTQALLVEQLEQVGVLSTPGGLASEAMRRVDRRHFCPSPEPYANVPVGIGGNATISTPQVHAQALNAIAESGCFEKSGGRRSGAPLMVCDVGCGSGYILACLVEMALLTSAPGEKIYALGIDHSRELTERVAPGNFTAAGIMPPGDCVKVEFTSADARGGLPPLEKEEEERCFDVIHCGAAAGSMAIVEELASRLADPHGRMLVPLGGREREQELLLVRRSGETQVVAPSIFAPLCSQNEQKTLTVPEDDATKAAKAQETAANLAERKAEVQQALARWKRDFEAAQGSAPTRDDMFGNADARALFDEFQALNKKRW